MTADTTTERITHQPPRRSPYASPYARATHRTMAERWREPRQRDAESCRLGNPIPHRSTAPWQPSN